MVRFALIVSALVFSSSTMVLADAHGDKAAASHSKSVKAYGRFVPEREDDFAWENDRVAFRIYGPSSNGKGPISGVDAWFKKVDYSIIDKWYAEHLSGKSYHEDHGEGLDIYHTGGSRGVGGTAIWVNGQAYPAGRFSDWKVVNETKDAFTFTVNYEWETPLGQVTEEKTIGIELGQQLYTVSSVFRLDGKPAQLPIAIGLTTHDGKASPDYSLEQGWAAAWEPFQDHHVGTGIKASSADKVERVLIEEVREKDRSHVWLITNTDNDGRLSYAAGFAWTAAGKIKDFNEWKQYLSNVEF